MSQKAAFDMMALNLRLRGIIRVDPCHPLAYKILHLGCVKFKSRWSTQSYSSLPIGTLHDPIQWSSVFPILSGLRILTYYLFLKLFFQLEIMQFLINCIPRPIILLYFYYECNLCMHLYLHHNILVSDMNFKSTYLWVKPGQRLITTSVPATSTRLILAEEK